MIAYLAPFLSFTALWYGVRKNPGARQQLYWMIFGILFIFVAWRWQVGCDWIGYQLNYLLAGSEQFDWQQYSSPLWWLTLDLMQHYDIAYQWVNVFAATIFFAGAHVLAQRQPDPLAFIIILFPVLIVNIAMSGLRQAIAIGFLMAALVAFSERRALLFVALIGIGSQFHNSALVFLLMAPLVGGNYSSRRLAIAFVLGIPGTIALLSGEAAETATSRYIGTGIDAAGALFRVGFVGLSGLFFLLFVRRAWKWAYSADFKLALIGSFMMVGCTLLLPISSVIADRFAYYLVPIQAIIIARMRFLPLPRSQKPMLVALPWIGLFAIFIVWLMLSDLFIRCYTPYQSWFFGVP